VTQTRLAARRARLAAAATAMAAVAAVAVTAAGCGAAPPGPAGCAASAVEAVRGHVTPARLPPSCRRLGAAALGQAVNIAVSDLSRASDKAVRRHQAGVARRRLGFLIAAANRAAARARRAANRSGRAGPGTRGPGGTGTRIPAGPAALAAWLLAAASGAFLFSGWLRHARSRRSGPRPRGSDWVILAHAGLALAGLAGWSGYLVTGSAAFAWAAAGVLPVVAGLGMSTLLLSIPEGDREARGRAPVAAIVVHGALATLVILLALLGAIAAVSSGR